MEENRIERWGESVKDRQTDRLTERVDSESVCVSEREKEKRRGRV